MTVWMRKALCVQVGDPDLWFPGRGENGRQARQVCGRCPVAAECDAYWLTLPDDVQRWGIWAGRSFGQRVARDGRPQRWCRHCGDRPVPAAGMLCSRDCAAALRRESQRRYEARRVRR